MLVITITMLMAVAVLYAGDQPKHAEDEQKTKDALNYTFLARPVVNNSSFERETIWAP